MSFAIDAFYVEKVKAVASQYNVLLNLLPLLGRNFNIKINSGPNLSPIRRLEERSTVTHYTNPRLPNTSQ